MIDFMIEPERALGGVRKQTPTTAMATERQCEPLEPLYQKYNCAACHGAAGVGGVYNANAPTGGMINGVRLVART